MNRFWLGFGSLILAVLLWANFGQREPVIQRELRVPLEARNVPAGLLAIDLPARTSVIAEGPRNQLDRLTTDAILVTVDLERAKSGTGTFPLTVTPPAGSRLKLDTRWPTMRLNLTPTAIFSRRVVIEAIGTPPAGYEYGGAEAEPEAVTITVPTRDRERLKEVRAVLDLSRLSSSVGYVEAELTAVDDKNQPVATALIEPARIRIRPKLDRTGEVRSLLINPAWQGTPPVGYRIDEVSISPRQVQVSGGVGSVVSTQPILLNGRTASFEQTVELVLPEGTELTTPGPITLRVTISKEAATTR